MNDMDGQIADQVASWDGEAMAMAQTSAICSKLWRVGMGQRLWWYW